MCSQCGAGQDRINLVNDQIQHRNGPDGVDCIQRNVPNGHNFQRSPGTYLAKTLCVISIL